MRVVDPQPPEARKHAGNKDEAVRSFFTEEERVLSDIAGGSGFTFKRGEGW